MAALGMPQTGGYPKAEWKALTKDRMAVARPAHLTHIVAEAKKDPPQRSDEAYMQGVTPAGQVGKWARLVPAFGTRVKYRRFRLGLRMGQPRWSHAEHISSTQSKAACLLMCWIAPHAYAVSWRQGTMCYCTALGLRRSGTMP